MKEEKDIFLCIKRIKRFVSLKSGAVKPVWAEYRFRKSVIYLVDKATAIQDGMILPVEKIKSKKAREEIKRFIEVFSRRDNDFY